MAQQKQMLQSLNKSFKLMVTLLGIGGAALLSYLLWLANPTVEGDVIVATRFFTSITIPLLICLGIWFWRPFIYSRNWRLFFCLTAFSMLESILVYFGILFSVLVLLRFIATFPQIAAYMLVFIVCIIPCVFPYRRIMNQYRALTLKSDFWEKKYKAYLPYFAGIVLAYIPIILALVL